MAKIISFVRARRLIVFIILIVAISLSLIFSLKGNGTPDTAILTMDSLVRKVEISGKVAPRESVNLGFESSGTISAVLKDVGDFVFKGETLVRLDANSISAQVEKAEADLNSSLAELNKLEGGTAVQTSVTNAKRTLVQALRDAYAAADDAVYNKTDQFFTNPRSGYPEISQAFAGYSDLRTSINKTRLSLEETMEEWKAATDSLSGSIYTEENVDLTKENLATLSAYLLNVSRAVNMFKTNDSLSQTTIDKYRADVLTARDNIAAANQNIINKEDALTKLLSDVPVQVARVEANRASLMNLRSQLYKTAIVSPITGVVSVQDAKPGQAVTIGTNLVTVISSDLVIETYIPEVSIAGVKIGDTAKVTLDAYGETEFFEARVSHIDPAETIRDGVSTYKVKLAFEAADKRIRSGMTANVEIETFRKDNVMTILERSVVREGDETFVYVLVGEKDSEKRAVVVGEKDSDGHIELISGITSEDRFLINPPKNK